MNSGEARRKLLSVAKSPPCLLIPDLDAVHRLDFGWNSSGESMARMPFMGPSREEVVATTTDLIARFGLRAHDEALHLEEVAATMRFARNRNLYRRAAREIEK